MFVFMSMYRLVCKDVGMDGYLYLHHRKKKSKPLFCPFILFIPSSVPTVQPTAPASLLRGTGMG